MRRLLQTLALTLVFGGPALATPGSETDWKRDFDAASREAGERGLHLLVAFTGSDWSRCSQTFETDLLRSEAFATRFGGHHVLVQLDFPYASKRVDQVPALERQRELQRRYEIRTFPELLALSPEGLVYAELRYRERPIAEQLDDLSRRLELGRRSLGDLAGIRARLASASTPEQRVEAAGWVCEWLESAAGARLCRRLWDQGVLTLIPLLDPDQLPPRLLARALDLCVSGDRGDARLSEAALRLDPRNELRHAETALGLEFRALRDAGAAEGFCDRLELFLDGQRGLKDPASVARWAAQAAFWCADAGLLADRAQARRLAQRALALPLRPVEAREVSALLSVLTGDE